MDDNREFFEIGNVYIKLSNRNKYYLALDDNELIYRDQKNNEFIIIDNAVKAEYELVKFFTVDSLCQRWNVTLLEIDEMTVEFFYTKLKKVSKRRQDSHSISKYYKDNTDWKRIRKCETAIQGKQ